MHCGAFIQRASTRSSFDVVALQKRFTWRNTYSVAPSYVGSIFAQRCYSMSPQYLVFKTISQPNHLLRKITNYYELSLSNCESVYQLRPVALSAASSTNLRILNCCSRSTGIKSSYCETESNLRYTVFLKKKAFTIQRAMAPSTHLHVW